VYLCTSRGLLRSTEQREVWFHTQNDFMCHSLYTEVILCLYHQENFCFRLFVPVLGKHLCSVQRPSYEGGPFVRWLASVSSVCGFRPVGSLLSVHGAYQVRKPRNHSQMALDQAVPCSLCMVHIKSESRETIHIKV